MSILRPRRKNAYESGSMGAPIMLDRSDLANANCIEIYKTGKIYIVLQSGSDKKVIEVKAARRSYDIIKKFFGLR